MKFRKILLERYKLILALGVSLISTGFVLLFTWPIFYENIVAKSFVLEPGSKTYDLWVKNPIPLKMKFHFFNWTNPEDIETPGVKPKFQQLGPYTFTEVKEKIVIGWNDNNTVTFKQKKTWQFDPESSNGTLDDVINTLHSVAVTAAYQSRNWSYILRKGISMSLSAVSRKIYITQTIGDILFYGYHEPLIDIAKSMPAMAGVKIPPFDKFAWFYLRNASDDFEGTFNMETGKGKGWMGELRNWNYDSKTEFYDKKCAGVDGGSAGEFFPRNVTRDTITMFCPDMCRNIVYEYEKDEEVAGITGYKFTGGDRMLDNGTIYPENKCFCNGDCIPSGLMNISACRYGSPGFVSFPHYYRADPYYGNLVEGMNPEQDKHEFYLILDPITGIPLEVAARFQINILLQPIPDVALFDEVPKIYFPILWFEQKATISDELAQGLKMLYALPLIGTCVSVSIIVIGFILVILIGVLLVLRILDDTKTNKKSHKYKITCREEVPLNEGNEMKITMTVKSY